MTATFNKQLAVYVATIAIRNLRYDATSLSATTPLGIPSLILHFAPPSSHDLLSSFGHNASICCHHTPCPSLPPSLPHIITSPSPPLPPLSSLSSPPEQNVAKILAKDYVRTKKHAQKFIQLRTYLQGIGLQLQTMKSVDTMASAMKNATRAMQRMNKRLNIPQLASVMQNFATESVGVEDKMDIMTSELDGVLGDEEEVRTRRAV